MLNGTKGEDNSSVFSVRQEMNFYLLRSGM